MRIEALRHDRDQLLAEAAHALRRGEQWWPDVDFERESIIPQQELRYEPDVWEQKVATYLASRSEATVSDIAQDALFIETPRVSTSDRNRITAILEALGWRRGPRTENRRPWIPPTAPRA